MVLYMHCPLLDYDEDEKSNLDFHTLITMF